MRATTTTTTTAATTTTTNNSCYTHREQLLVVLPPYCEYHCSYNDRLSEFVYAGRLIFSSPLLLLLLLLLLLKLCSHVFLSKCVPVPVNQNPKLPTIHHKLVHKRETNSTTCFASFASVLSCSKIETWRLLRIP